MSTLNDLHNYRPNSQSRKAKIWAIGGGKGGVGKSLMTANTSICLALLGHKVITIDLDLGGANLHTCLGLKIPDKTLSDYLNHKVASLDELLVPSGINNLQVICGAQDDLGIANLKNIQKNKILNKIFELDADYILLDLGAGTTAATLDFFIAADQGILVVLPEPTSIENTYRFLKACYQRRLDSIDEFLEIAPIIGRSLNAKLSAQTTAPSDMIKSIIKEHPELGASLKTEIEKFSPNIILNQVRGQSDIDIGFAMKNVCYRYFGLNLNYAGYLDYDAAVWQSVKKRKPLLMEFPNSKLVNRFDSIVQKLLIRPST